MKITIKKQLIFAFFMLCMPVALWAQSSQYGERLKMPRRNAPWCECSGGGYNKWYHYEPRW
jgi:hypothetical protein